MNRLDERELYWHSTYEMWHDLADWLATEPSNLSTEQQGIWNDLRPFSPEFLQYWWNVVENDDTLMIDPDTTLESWTDSDYELEGMRT